MADNWGRSSTEPKMEIGAAKKEIKSEQNQDIFKEKFNNASTLAKNIIHFTLINKQIYVLRFYNKVVPFIFMKKITIRSFLGAYFPFAPNSEHCTENRDEWRPWAQ